MIALWFFAACGGGAPDVPADTAVPVTWPMPTVAFAAPADDVVVEAEGFDATVTVTGFRFEPKEVVGVWRPVPWGPLAWSLLGTASAHVLNEEPNGYIAWSIDQTLTFAETVETTVRVPTEGLTPGEHVLWAELFYPDGDFFYPPVIDSVRFVVTEPPPADTDTDGGG